MPMPLVGNLLRTLLIYGVSPYRLAEPLKLAQKE